MNNTRFDLPRICLWIALALALIGTVGNTAWAFASVDNDAHLMSYVKAIALDVGMVAVAATLAQRKRAQASTRWLWVAVICFVLGSMYANYLHGQTHLVANSANLADWRPVILSALLPLMLFALVEIVAHTPQSETPNVTPATNTPQQESNIVTLEVAPSLPPQPAPLPAATHSQPVPLDDLDRAIMAAFRANPAASKSAVAREAGTTRQTVDNRLTRMQAAGLAHVNGVVTVNE